MLVLRSSDIEGFLGFSLGDTSVLGGNGSTIAGGKYDWLSSDSNKTSTNLFVSGVKWTKCNIHLISL